jgi:hypothetical protein
MITPNLTFICTCPCCGKPALIQLIEIDGVITSVGLFHISREVSGKDLSELGYELGVIPPENGGESYVGENQVRE